MSTRLAFRPVTLDHEYGDTEGMLVFREDRLMAVLSRLGDLHEQLAGSWYIEASFSHGLVQVGGVFGSLPEFERWIVASGVGPVSPGSTERN